MYQRIVTSEWSRPGRVTGQRRLLIESPNPLMGVADFAAFQEAGFEVAVCAGPAQGGDPCPLADGRACPFVLVSDVVLFGLDPDTRAGHEVLAALRAHHPRTAVVVAVPADDETPLPDGCTRLPLPASTADTVAILNRAAEEAAAG